MSDDLALINDPQVVAENDPTHRRLAAIAGAGNSYLFVVVEQSGGTAIEYRGFYQEDLPAVFRELASITDAEVH
jgi:hypothetical protein